ncbi:hypothetical protein LZ686_17270 [Paracoccus sp. NFXS7]|uniref:hypothetical protein n=1 Tax=Paracoccus sp. NFXS7 TaxID=2908653 RepID=UPI0032DEE962
MSIPEYQQAYREFKAARSAAIAMAENIGKINDALRYDLRSFIGYNFNIDIQPRSGVRYNEKSRVAMTDWPSSEQMDAVIRAWTQSYLQLHKRWGDVLLHDREGLIPPPEQLRLSEH